MYIKLTSPRGHLDLSIDFAQETADHTKDCTTNKTIPGLFHVQIFQRIYLLFAEHQESSGNGLG